MLGADGGNIAPFISVVTTLSDHPVAHKVTSGDRRVSPRHEILLDLMRRYGFAILVSCVALVLSHFSQRVTHNDDFDICQAAVVLTAWYGGFGPGIAASALSVLALDYFFIPPLYTLNLGFDDFIRLVIFGAVAILTSWLSSQLKKTKMGLERSNLELKRSNQQMESRVQQRTEELSRLNVDLKAEVEQRLQAEKTIIDISSREQRRLGEDLHDGLCQLLAGTRLATLEVKKRLEAKSIPEAADVATIESNMAEALAQADSISRGLYPVELETNGLMAALEELSAKISKIFPATCQFICWQPVLIPDSTVSLHLYRIAQEAVMNAIKGGKAKRMNIRLKRRGARVILSIADNVVGFQAQAPRHGMGLKIMNYRAKLIGASLQFKSHLHRGTVVTCSLEAQ
jgi:signal transduction histidine kinase